MQYVLVSAGAFVEATVLLVAGDGENCYLYSENSS